MSDRIRLALSGFGLSLLLLAAAEPHAAHAAALHHPRQTTRATTPHSTTHRAPRHPTHRAVPKPLAQRQANSRNEAEAAPVWSDASGQWRQTGIASWYGGHRWQGNRTADGSRFNDAELTAAHATLPLGSKVRVVVQDTGRSVVVTINDRPGTRRRIIDLSRAAAQHLGILERGIATVTLIPTN